MFDSLRLRGLGAPSLFAAALLVASCSADTAPPEIGEAAEELGATLPYPILFVTQVPVSGFASVTAAFGNHSPQIGLAPRGGDLHILYPDGTLRNLTAEAGFGVVGSQDAAGIAVREPCVHWSGQKALFSMIIGGAPAPYRQSTSRWQIYEVTGLGQGQTATITRVSGQPIYTNNVSPIYGTDDRVIFTSDLPRNGSPVLYPQLDEYESKPTVSGLWSLDPTTGGLFLVSHDPSGAFSPSIDSAGRLIYTRWDHLQRDQQADYDRMNGGTYGSFNYADESGAPNGMPPSEVFPESRLATDPLLPANVSPHTFNLFFPWMVNEDGSGHETVNHVGNQELGGAYQPGSFTDDPNLTYYTPQSLHQNQRYIRGSGGMFHLKEDPTRPGTFFATEAEEFATDTAGAIVSFTGGVGVNPDQMVITSVTDPTARNATTSLLSSHPGHFRNPLPLSDGTVIASHAADSRYDNNDGTPMSPSYRYAFRLKRLTQQGGSYWSAGAPLTQGITKSITYWSPDYPVTVTAPLWELDPVEVRPRAAPAKRVDTLPLPEAAVLQQKGVSEAALRAWLANKGLALVVSRNVTSRDRADVQQPFNLRVPGGVQSIAKGGKVYDVPFLQLFQGDQIRGYKTIAGRRVLAQPLHDPAAQNPPSSGPAGSVRIAPDGSMAALVPARRALTWQLTDPNGKPVVRERSWVSFAPGEIRACPSCHGVNTRDQLGRSAPTNPPAALGAMIDYLASINAL